MCQSVCMYVCMYVGLQCTMLECMYVGKLSVHNTSLCAAGSSVFSTCMARQRGVKVPGLDVNSIELNQKLNNAQLLLVLPVQESSTFTFIYSSPLIYIINEDMTLLLPLTPCLFACLFACLLACTT